VLALELQPVYKADRDAYFEYLARYDAEVALARFEQQLGDRILLLRRQPELYPEDPEYAGTGYRSCYLAPHFRLFYRFDATQLVLLRLWDTRQNPAERLVATD